ncbi:MAG: hypothetical protein FJX95_07270 [Bacteroidetes bacterium]|nr:hypothetical protein [Bacteroidota bacterium]
MKAKYQFLFFFVLLHCTMGAQPSLIKSSTIISDTTLKPLEFFDYSKSNTQAFMPDVKEGIIYKGKASHNVFLKNMQVDATGNAARQWFSKVPGVSVWESDGSGLNTSVSTRGWSPNRSWDLNVRMDGIDIASDPIGYPEAYYTPPTEFIQSIELTKGAGALAFGTQFGGALNYKTIEPSIKKISYSGLYSVGSFGTESHFHGLSGRKGKNSFGGWFQERQSDGWRDNSEYKTKNYLLKWNRIINSNWRISAEYNKHHSISQQPGGLTDEDYHLNVLKSSRSRNWFEIDWQVVGASAVYQKGNWIVKNQVSYMLGKRNSIGFVNDINVEDVYVDSIGFSQRQLDKDKYNNLTYESRYQNTWRENTVFAGGVRYFQGKTDRLQKGKGTRNSDADFNLDIDQNFERDLNYYSRNMAAYQEAILSIGQNLKFVPGLRYEWIQNSMNGKYSSSYEILQQSKSRQVLLYGASVNYEINRENEIAFNYNRSYRPALFSELTPTATSDQVDGNIQDAKGYNVDLMIRGKVISHLGYHLGAYYTFYGNRLGSYKKDGILYKTNIGDAVSKGIECMGDYTWTNASKLVSFNIWASLAWMDVRYTRWNDPTIVSADLTIENKRVENAPKYIHRAGANFSFRKLTCQAIWNSIGSVYTDALNTEESNAKATVGKIDAYQIIDCSVKYNFSSHLYAQLNVNNVGDVKYATRRSGGFPGPGLLPGSPRMITVTLGLNL